MKFKLVKPKSRRLQPNESKRLSLRKTNQSSVSSNSKPEAQAKVLPKVPSSRVGSFKLRKPEERTRVTRLGGKNSTAVSVQEITLAANAKEDEVYWTAQSADPNKKYMCRTLGESPKKDTYGNRMYTLTVYFPTLNEWREVDVPSDYKLTLSVTLDKQNKESNMKLKKQFNKAKARVNGNGKALTKQQDVFHVWGQAFKLHGNKGKKAPNLIASHMKKEFPKRKCQFDKWVNNLRARYNAGKLPGVPAPKEKIAVYK